MGFQNASTRLVRAWSYQALVTALALPGFILHDGAFAKEDLVRQWAWIEKVLKQMTGDELHKRIG